MLNKQENVGANLCVRPEKSKGQTHRSAPTFKALPRLSLLVGPAGIGKTHFLLEGFTQLLHESKNPFKRDILYIIPTAEHRERIVDLVLRKDGKGFLGERVLTLSRLMREVLKVGDFRLITDAERRFLLDKIVIQKSGSYFSSVNSLTGFLEKMGEFVGELKESMISLGTFKKGVRALKKTRPETGDKYEGLLQVYEEYENRLEALGLKDHRDGSFLIKETEKQKEASLPRFHHLFIDGFFDFSKSQFEFLRWLIDRSGRVTMTLTIDLSLKRQGLFAIPRETLKELEKLGFEAVELSGWENHRSESACLQHIERGLFQEKVKKEKECDSLTILEATGIRGEVEMIAREIRRVVRTGKFHFSDIAVILRRVGEYESLIRTVFREFRIPVEIHERERLRDAPLARTLASLFKIFLNDWKREDLFNFLKSSFVEKDYSEICSLEIQAFDLSITDGRSRWLNEMKSPLFEKIDTFQKRFEEGQTIIEWIRITEEAIHAFSLDRIPVLYEEKARRDFSTLKQIQGLLEEIRSADIAGGSSVQTFENFAQELLGLIEVDLFSLHDRDKNCVQVYNISLARQKEYKVVFLADLLEKHFPAEVREDPILSDKERHVLGLPERLPRQALERYFFYLGITRARERVILSYPRFDLEGHEALPSFYVDELGRLFESPLPTQTYPVNQSLPKLEDAVEEREIGAHLIRRLYGSTRVREKRERIFTLNLYNHFIERNSFQALLPKILFDPVAKIEDEKVRAFFYPPTGVFKPTGLEAYGKCSYRYFASQILGLEEKEDGIDARAVGIILHEVLENYWRERVEKGREELADPERAKEFVSNSLQELLEKKPLSGDHHYRIELKKKDMEEWLCRMVEKEIEEGNPLEPLHPKFFELGFGFKKDKSDTLKLLDPLKQDLLLRGKIDRVDVDPSGKFGLVIDYKTGGEFRRASLDFGTALQLPLYLLAIKQRLGLKAVGALIYKINEAESKGFYAKENLSELGTEVRSQNIYAQEEFNKIIDRAVRFSFQFAEGITKAEIPVRPRDCDPHCPFPALCRIEKWRLPFIYQEIREEDKKNGIV